MKRKVLSIILTLSMALSMLSVTAWAAETEPGEMTEAAVSSDAVEPSETTAEAAAPSDDAVEAPETVVANVQALIDALPAMEDVQAMDLDGQRAAYEQLQTAYDAYMALSEEQRGLVTGGGVFEELFAFFNGQTATTAMELTGDVTWNGVNYEQAVTIAENKTVTITLMGTNVVKSDTCEYAAINVPKSSTLIIKGNGSLDAYGFGAGGAGGNGSAGIGGGRYGNNNNPFDQFDCGSIIIESGTVYAQGGYGAAGIGMSHYQHDEGSLTIHGGTVTARGGNGAKGIGVPKTIKSGSGFSVTVDYPNHVAYGSESEEGSLVAIDERNGVNWKSYGWVKITSSPVSSVGSTGAAANGRAVTVRNTEETNISSLVSIEPASLSSAGFVYSISGNNDSGTTIDGNGVLKIGNGETASQVTVTAVSKADYSKSSTITATIEYAPKAKSGLVYTGSALQLVEPPSVNSTGLQYSLNGGSFSTTVPTAVDAGTYTVQYQTNGANYVGTAGSKSFTVNIAKANSTVTPSANNATVNYGGTLTLSATAGISTLAAQNQMEFVVNGTKTFAVNVSGVQATTTVDVTSANGFTIGSNKIKVNYGGSANLNESSSNEITVTVNPKIITGTISGITTKTYDGTTAAPVGLSLKLNDIVSGDTVAAANVTYTYNNANVSDAKTITANVTLSGAHAGYYTLTAPTVQGTITPAPLTITPPDDQFIYNGNNTFTFDMATGVNNERVTVTLTASGSDAGNYTYNENGGDHTYKVGLSNSNYNVSLAGTLTINKANQEPPKAGDIKVSKSSDSITVISPTGPSVVGAECQYFVGGTTVPNESQWSDSPHFTELDPGKEYTVYVRYKWNTNYYASGFVTATVTTLAADGSATLQPGESVKTENGTVTNNGDHITVTDEEGNTTTVTPAPTEGVEVDGDGNVAVPKNGKVKTGSGPERTLPEGGTVSGDGTVTADEIVVGDTTVKGDDVTADKDGNVTVPEGGVVKPKDGPEMTLPDGGVVEADGDITFPEGGSAKVGDTTVTVPEGGTLEPDGKGGVNVSESGTVTPPGGPDITLSEGGTLDADGNIIPEGGSAQVGDATVTVPEESGGTLEPDGHGGVSVPEGSTVTPPGGPDITVGPENGGTVDKDGNVTLPGGGSAELGDDTTVTVPEEGGTLKPDGKGNVTVPGGSTVVDGEGKERTVPSQGGTVGKDGTYKDNPIPSSGNSGSSGSFGSSGGDYVSTHTITVSQAKHGKVTVRPSSASSGQIVTVTVTPDKGYILSKLTVTDSRGNELTLTDKGDGVYAFTMPFGGTIVEALFVPRVGGETGTDSPEPAFPTASAFSDLSPDAWYWDAVDYVIRNGLMNGYGYRDRTFGPNDTLTRAMLAQVLYNQIGRPGVNGNILLADASSGAWYTDAITWAATNEIIYGYGKGEYGPDDPVTREQLAVMLYRFEQSRGGGFAGEWTPDYPDTSEISEYALEAVTWCAVNGILGGYDDGALRPRGNATRAETAVMLMRFLSL